MIAVIDLEWFEEFLNDCMLIFCNALCVCMCVCCWVGKGDGGWQLTTPDFVYFLNLFILQVPRGSMPGSMDTQGRGELQSSIKV